MPRRLIGFGLIGYLTVVAFGVFGPAPGGFLDRVEQYLRSVERRVVGVWTGHPAVGSSAFERLSDVWPFGDVGFENLANIALFVPLALAFPLLWPRWRWWTVPAGIALSVGIELTQRVLMPWRSSSVEDVICNSLGAAIGFSLGLVIVWRWGAPSPSPRAGQELRTAFR